LDPNIPLEVQQKRIREEAVEEERKRLEEESKRKPKKY